MKLCSLITSRLGCLFDLLREPYPEMEALLLRNGQRTALFQRPSSWSWLDIVIPSSLMYSSCSYWLQLCNIAWNHSARKLRLVIRTSTTGRSTVSLARDFSIWRFAVFPFISLPNGLCCCPTVLQSPHVNFEQLFALPVQ